MPNSSNPPSSPPLVPPGGPEGPDQGEIWRAVPGFEGRYEVSTHGRVRSLAFRNNHSFVPRLKILRNRISSADYCRVSLGSGTRISKRDHAVHVLVLEAFIGPRPAQHEAAHLNGNRQDNRLVNLVWATRSENFMHKWNHGTMAHGESSWTAKLTDERVREIRRLGRSHRHALAQQFGVSVSTVEAVLAGKTWRHVR